VPEKLIYVLRHAKSSRDEPELADHDRPLNPRGRQAAQRMAERMRRERVAPALVLCSSARRARETLVPIEQTLRPKAKIKVEDRLYPLAPAGVGRSRLHRGRARGRADHIAARGFYH
jgi:phosphohistidine phosphatase